jgi:hypothetical protein
MASPFRYFRKHTKAFMAIAAVMCMFLFVFASGTGGGGGSDDRPDDDGDPVATWNGGSLNVGQLRSLVQQRMVTDQFLRMLFRQGGGATEYDLPNDAPSFLLPPDRSDIAEANVIETEVFASLATDAGMTVDDAMINHYLQKFGRDRVGTEEIQGILANIGGKNVDANTSIVFSQLRKLLLSYFYQAGFADAGLVVLPTQRWDDWRRVNERISLQVAVLPVEGFLADVTEPTEGQLKKLYDEYDDVEPDDILTIGGRELPSPNPGFAVPRRVKLRYLKGNVAERAATLLDSVTEDEIADYYEQNKLLFVKTEDTELDFGGEDADAEGTEEADDAEVEGEEAAGEAPEGEAAEGEQTEADAVEGEAETTDEADVAEPAAVPAAESPGGADAAVEGEGEPADEAAAPTTEEAAPTTEETQPAAGEGEQSLLPRRSPFVLAALQAEPAAGEAAVEAVDEEAGEAVEDAEAAADATVEEAEAEQPAEDDAADPADPAAETAAGEAAEGEGVEEAEVAEGVADAEATGEEGAEAEAEEVVEYVPLEEVQDEIRETLARDKAAQALERDIGEASVKLAGEYRVYGRALIKAEAEGQKAPAVPERLASLDWLAEEYGLTEVTSDPLTARNLFETVVGAAVDEQSGRITVTRAAFLSLEPFEPFLAREQRPPGQDVETWAGDWYLVMKVEDTPQRVPPFAEVRDQVAAAWKRIEAAKRAEDKAKELADGAERSDAGFAQYFAEQDQGYEVIEQTAMFSWREYPTDQSDGAPLQLSDVPELKNVGPEFMETVFSLKDGQAAGLLNYDRSVAYVVRLHSRQYSPDALKVLFLLDLRALTQLDPTASEQSFMEAREQYLFTLEMQQEHQRRFRESVTRRIWVDVAEFKFDEEWEQLRAERLAESQ